MKHSELTDTLYIKSITGPDINNGIGVRLTIWVQGCKHNCDGCQNMHTHEYTKEGNFTVDGIVNIVKEKLLQTDSDGKYLYDGVTFSGGDPLCQSSDALYDLKRLIFFIKEIRPDINIWIYTGFTMEYLLGNELYKDLLYRIMPDVIVDGRFVKELKPISPSDCPWRGSSNQRIINAKETLKTGQITLLEL